MNCPFCKSDCIVKFFYAYPIRNSKGHVIGYEPQFRCFNCYKSWDIIERE